MLICDQAQTEYVIVQAEEAIASERTAARELQGHLKTIGGVDIQIRSEAETQGRTKKIVVGPCATARAALPDVDWAALGSDGIVIRAVGDTLYLAGGRPRGTLYAVYTFLEDDIGCRWWTSTESIIPRRTTLDLKVHNLVYTPRLKYRETFYSDQFNGVFAARCKNNGVWINVPDEFGGHYQAAGQWMHAFGFLLPPDKYFDAHPEWFSLRDGQRLRDRWQPCLSNKEMQAEMTRNALGWLAEHPEARLISVDQTDQGRFCQCESCQAITRREGSEAGPLLECVNAVAAEIEKQYPDVQVVTLAYRDTLPPPRYVRPRRNVLVYLTTYTCSRTEPLGEGDQNGEFRKNLEGWAAIAPGQLMVWDYVADFKNYLSPHPNLNVIEPNLQFLLDHGVVGLLEQGDEYSGGQVGDFAAMRAWVISHLLWDPSRGMDALMTEFMEGYYGPAAEPLTRYLHLVNDALTRSNQPITCAYVFHGDYLNLDVMCEATRLLDRAAGAVRGNPMLESRVRRARLGLDFEWLLRYRRLLRSARLRGEPFEGPPDSTALANEVVDALMELGAVKWREGEGVLTDETRSLFRNWAKPSVPPSGCAGEICDGWIEVRGDEFTWKNNYEGPRFPYVQDPLASCGVALVLYNVGAWEASYALSPELAHFNGGHGHWYLTLRNEPRPGATGKLLGVVVRRAEDNAVLYEHEVTAEDHEDGAYYTLDLGNFQLAPGDTITLVPPEPNAQLGVTYIDRLYCVAG